MHYMVQDTDNVIHDIPVPHEICHAFLHRTALDSCPCLYNLQLNGACDDRMGKTATLE